MMIRLALVAILIFFPQVRLSELTPPKIVASPVVVKPAPEKPWNRGTITTYANYFEGRKMANGDRFRHAGYTVASRGGKLGQKIEIRYGNQRIVTTLTDRGGLPLHQPNRWQFDTTRAVARKLGLYRLHKGKTDRNVDWRFVDDR